MYTIVTKHTFCGTEYVYEILCVTSGPPKHNWATQRSKHDANVRAFEKSLPSGNSVGLASGPTATSSAVPSSARGGAGEDEGRRGGSEGEMERGGREGEGGRFSSSSRCSSLGGSSGLLPLLGHSVTCDWPLAGLLDCLECFSLVGSL